MVIHSRLVISSFSMASMATWEGCGQTDVSIPRIPKMAGCAANGGLGGRPRSNFVCWLLPNYTPCWKELYPLENGDVKSLSSWRGMSGQAEETCNPWFCHNKVYGVVDEPDLMSFHMSFGVAPDPELWSFISHS
jgi:hypothetical protein